MNGRSAPLIPVYLNQRILFDLVAMLQGGISTVTRVSETTQGRTSSANDVGASFGLPEAFASLLKINLAANRKGATSDETGRKSEEERVHTPASLFFELRNLLAEKNLLCQDGTSLRASVRFWSFQLHSA